MRPFILAATLLATGPAMAASFTVNATDNIYGAGQTSAPGGGTLPQAVLKLGATAACVEVVKITGSLACAAKTGCITLNNGGNLNDADGVGAAPATSFNSGTSLISGLTAPNAGFLVGLFTTKAGPKGPAPSPLDFTTGTGTAFSSLSPVLDQTFFIGDGRTRNNAGAKQTFIVPKGAKKLYLGISDACNYNGSPGCLDDNSGTYKVALKVYNATCP